MTNYTNADLTGQTVKALNVLAKSLGMKRYSALRKADLVAAIIDFTAPEIELTPIAEDVKILDVDNATDQDAIRKVMAEVAPVTFSAAPVKAPQTLPAPRKVATLNRSTNRYAEVATDELVAAYTGYRATFRKARGITQVKLGATLRAMSAELKARKVAMREV